jgi:hypothetical protein
MTETSLTDVTFPIERLVFWIFQILITFINQRNFFQDFSGPTVNSRLNFSFSRLKPTGWDLQFIKNLGDRAVEMELIFRLLNLINHVIFQTPWNQSEYYDLLQVCENLRKVLIWWSRDLVERLSSGMLESFLEDRERGGEREACWGIVYFIRLLGNKLRFLSFGIDSFFGNWVEEKDEMERERVRKVIDG